MKPFQELKNKHIIYVRCLGFVTSSVCVKDIDLCSHPTTGYGVLNKSVTVAAVLRSSAPSFTTYMSHTREDRRSTVVKVKHELGWTVTNLCLIGKAH